MFDTWSNLKSFIERYLLQFFNPLLGTVCRKRIQEYLLGRWVTTFLFPQVSQIVSQYRRYDLPHG